MSFACKQRGQATSENKADFAFARNTKGVNFLNAHQLTYLAELAYQDRDRVQAFADQFGMKLESAENINETAYFIVANEGYVVVSFRGTEKNVEDLRTDFNFFHRAFVRGAVHCGFCQAYDSVKAEIRTSIVRLFLERPREVYFTGHSLGGALANVAAIDITHQMEELAARYPSSHLRDFKISGLYTFGAPRVFDAEGARHLDQKIERHYRFVYGDDLVVRLPFKLMGFAHAGQGFYFDKKTCRLQEPAAKRQESNAFSIVSSALAKVFARFSIKDHSLENYRKCFTKAGE